MKIAIPLLLVGVVLGFVGSLFILEPAPRALPAAPDADQAAELERLENQNLALAALVEKLQREVAEYQRQLRAVDAADAADSVAAAESDPVATDPTAEAAAAIVAAEGGDVELRQGRPRWGRDEQLSDEEILELLQSENARDRMRALRALVAMGDKTQAYALALEQLQDSENPTWVLFQAMQALVELDPTAAAGAIAPLLTGEDNRLASLAARQLGEIDTQDSRDALYAGLQSDSERVRLDSAKALQKLGDNSGIAQVARDLAADLNNADGGVREQAIRQLSGLGDPSYNNQLSAALTDSNSQVRRAAADGLGRQGTPADLPALETLRNDPQRDVSRAAERAIRLIQNPEEQARAASSSGGRGGSGRGGRRGR